MDRIRKALEKLSKKEIKRVKDGLQKLKKRPWPENLDIKKLKGREDIFRLRKGSIRIIFRVSNNKVFLLKIERRNSDTYK